MPSGLFGECSDRVPRQNAGVSIPSAGPGVLAQLQSLGFGRDLIGHAVVETYSVLTRLPGDARLAPPDAARLRVARSSSPLMLSSSRSRRLPEMLRRLGVAGGRRVRRDGGASRQGPRSASRHP